MKKKTVKTNAMRHLDTEKIEYIPHELDHLDALDAVTVAHAAGADPKQVFKTLVLEDGKGGYYVAMIPAEAHLSLKKAARAFGVKSVNMIPQKKLQPLTGYVHGGCSPYGMKKQFPTLCDQSAKGQKTIYFSGGKIGVQIEMDPSCLSSTGIGYADLAE